MKLPHEGRNIFRLRSPPAREAWVEILMAVNDCMIASSPPAREAWVEICAVGTGVLASFSSPPAREAWVEIHRFNLLLILSIVASREGGVG